MEIIVWEKKLKRGILWAIKLIMTIKIFKSYLVSNKSKLKVYWTIIRFVIAYAKATWVIKESMKQNLLITERRIRRGSFRRTQDTESTWRIKSLIK